MRRIPPGQLQRFYKRLADLYQRYPNRWAKEKGYSDADYYLEKTRKLLMALKAGLEGRPLPDTGEAPQQREIRAMHRLDYPQRGVEHRGQTFQEYYDDSFQPDEEEEYEPPMPPQRQIRLSPGGSRFVPKTRSKSRSVRPAFMRKR